MGFNYTFAKLSGQLDESGWTQFYEFAPSDQDQQDKGELVFLISSSSNTPDYFAKAREVASFLHECYYTNAGKPYDALEATVRQVSKRFTEELPGIELAAIATAGGVLYMSAVGEASILVARQGKLVPVLVSDESRVISASGTITADDVVVLLTKQAKLQFAQSLIAQALTEDQLSVATSVLSDSLGFSSPQGSLGVGLLKFTTGNETEPIVAQVPKSEPLGKVRQMVKFPSRKVQVNSDMVSQESAVARKKTVLVGIILLGLLIISIVFGTYQKGRVARQSDFETRLAAATHSYDEAVNLFSLNPERSRELFAQSRSAADELVSAGFNSPELTALLDKLAASKQNVLGEYDGNPQLFLDLKLVSADFQASKLGATTDRVVVLDDAHNNAISVGLAAKTTETLAGPDDLDGVNTLVAWDTRNYAQTNAAFFDLSASDVVVPKDWTGDLPPIVYAGNLYVLDESENTIWRFPGVPSGFGAKENWLAQGDVTSTVSWAIDGSVWLLKPSGQVLNFLGGAPKDFTITGVVEGTDGFDKIYTNDEVADLYFLDIKHSRVVVLGKDGAYIAQYSFDTSDILDFVVSEKNKELVLLTTDKLLSVELRHLQ